VHSKPKTWNTQYNSCPEREEEQEKKRKEKECVCCIFSAEVSLEFKGKLIAGVSKEAEK